MIAQSLPRFLHAHPGLRVVMCDAHAAGRMLAHNADAAICIGQITDPDLVADEIGAVRSITCASPDFIEWAGVPESPADIDPDHCIAVLESGTHCAQEWLFRRNSETYAILPTAPLAFGHGDFAIAAAVHGGGYARVLCIEAEQQIASGLLRPVLSNWNDASQPVAMVHARCRHVSKEILAFREFMASIFPSAMARSTACAHHGPTAKTCRAPAVTCARV